MLMYTRDLSYKSGLLSQGDCPASPVAEVAPQGQGGEGEAGWMGYLSKAVAYLPAQVQ